MLSKLTMKYLFGLFLLGILASCKKPEEFPDVPVINFTDIYSTQNAQGHDDNLTIVLNFTDGDGDVGYKELGQNGPPYDTQGSQYYNNYLAKLFLFKNNAWSEYPTVLPLGGRLPYLTPDGKNKALKGQITCNFILAGIMADQDTFRLDVFIYDRALHQSNVVTTSEIVLNTQ
jgi:hypothetical protein